MFYLVNKVVVEINERKRQVENQAKILSINHSINWPDDWDLRNPDPPQVMIHRSRRSSFRRKNSDNNSEVRKFYGLFF